nr:hypothetical protein [Paenibacillus glycanilyticus]
MYKEYNMDQLSLPMDLQEDIPENHLVRVINDAVKSLRYEPLYESLSRR